jgi:formate hydrogenlyase subunit 6/NADH:ubiquinone oxidoreductase subunit I
MRWPARMTRQLLQSLLKKPATIDYPSVKGPEVEGLRGKLNFIPEKCVGCRLCMRDCPSGAIEIRKVAEKVFEAEINLGSCIFCGQCVDSCARKALQLTGEFELAELSRAKLKIVFHAQPERPPEG